MHPLAAVPPAKSRRNFSDFILERISKLEVDGLKRYPLRNGVNTLGRNDHSDIKTDSQFSSRDHCTITVNGDQVHISDQSANGTFVNQSKINKSRCIANGDIIGIGCSYVDQAVLLQSSTILVFQLKRLNAVSDVVELTDNEEDHVISLDSDEDVSAERSAVNTSTESDSGDDDDDADNVSMQMHASVYMEMKQEMLDLDDYLTDMSFNPQHVDIKVEIKTEPEEEYSCTATVIMPSAGEEGESCDRVKSLTEQYPVLDEEMVDRKPIIICPPTDDAICIDDEDELRLQGWIRRLVPRSDSAYRQSSSSCPDQTERTPEKSNTNAVQQSASPVKKRQASISAENTQDSHSTLKKRKIEKQSKLVKSVKTSSETKSSASSHVNEKDVTLSPPKEKEDVRLQLLIKQQQRVVAERSIKVINALNHPKQGKSSSKSSLKVKPVKKFDVKSKIKSQDENRKSRLKELAETGKKAVATTVRLPAKPKVKLTINNRSSFLADLSSLPPKPSDIKKKKDTAAPSAPVPSAYMATIKHHTTRPKLTEAAQQVIQEFIDANNTAQTLPFGISSVSLANMSQARSSLMLDETISTQENTSAKSITRSILRRAGTPHSGRTVRFAEQLTNIRVFCTDSPEPQSIGSPTLPLESVMPPLTNSHEAMRDRSIRNLRDPHGNPVNKIISAVTGWNPEWLQQPSSEAEINAPDTEPMELRNNFADFAMYLRHMVPLMKLELWAIIHSNYNNTSKAMAPIKITVNSAFSEHSKHGLRHVLHCKLVSDTVRLNEYSSLILVSYSQGSITYKFLAMVTQRRYDPNDTSRTVLFTMESSNAMANALGPKTPFVQIQIVALDLNIEINMFRAVMQLDTSPLMQPILRPRDFPMQPLSETNSINKPFVYKGYQVLSAEQLQIVRHISCAPPTSAITLVEGPPGSGKSQLIANLLTHIMCGGTVSIKPRRILVCAYSHAAVDEICRNLIRVRSRQTPPLFSLVRFGHQDQIHTEVKSRSLESLAQRPKTLSQLEEEKSFIKLKIAAMRFSNISPVQRQNDTQYFACRLDSVEKAIIRAKSHQTADNSSIEVYRYLLGSTDIICATLSNCPTLLRFISNVDLCIVDEATNCAETLTLLPLQIGIRSLVLVGDSHKMSSYTFSPKARQMGLNRSLFERICSAFVGQKDVGPVFRLDRQYRMHPEICAWPRQQFYGERMQTDDSAVTNAARFPLRPYVMLNILLASNNASDECRFLERMLRVLAPYLKNSTVGIIIPKFVHPVVLTDKLRELPFHQSLTIKGVDDFKGQEYDVIVLFNPRSYRMGFMDQPLSLKVALTRARKCLILCGYFTNLMNNDMCKSIFVNAMQRKCYSDMENIEDEVNFEKAIVEYLVKPEFK